MKKLTLYTLIALGLTATGCKKFLEQSPDNRASLETPEQVAQLLGTAYPRANYMCFFESASDNANDKGFGFYTENTNVDAYLFQDVREDQEDSPEYYWNACYTAIAAANQALETISKAEKPADYAAQKGEALLARAYAHFMLATVFCETYDPATAASSPGIPYVTTPEKEVIKQYERKTVAYVYEMIEKDLLTGLPLINDNLYTVPRYHFNKAAANAFAARFYLFKQDWTTCASYASVVFSSGNIAGMLRPWNTTYKTLTYNELWAVYAKATEPANLLLIHTPSTWGRYYYTFRYSMDADVRDEIFASNPTGGGWAFENQTYTVGTNNYLIPKVNEHFIRSSVNADIGTANVVVPALTAEEVLFNRAEANTYLGLTDAALADLNIYASTRIDDYNPAAHTLTAQRLRTYYGTNNLQLALIQTILDFKRAEYAQEGMRWLDILRYHIPVIHNTAEGETEELTGDDKRRLFQIPQSAKISGIELNPR
ncbi:RagB/SusD family nutrient uptake outer membrane protein [Chitinophaga horti]|uniref:RagB/SusD family nutrient uptake outer membrane protein n=1 Tax=Chitinophaga horti TaxID=2920382 RepID=A0ABY6IWL7_9BACT|nr:RagB/SusD family nutrient uptake outer membrane protein [Chitinophaga horti]UYQ91761.1 RagB/SusD family nutrient uptake outer membrane protein [Chitinophaga horti]